MCATLGPSMESGGQAAREKSRKHMAHIMWSLRFTGLHSAHGDPVPNPLCIFIVDAMVKRLVVYALSVWWDNYGVLGGVRGTNSLAHCQADHAGRDT